MKKILFTLVIFIGFSYSTTSQNNKAEEKAKEQISKINQEIKAENADLVLTDSQVKEVIKIHTARLADLKKMRKATSDKAKVKELSKTINKKYFSKIYKEVLTKKQNAARGKGKKKLKS